MQVQKEDKDRVLNHLETSVEKIGFPMSISVKTRIPLNKVDKILDELIKDNKIEKILVPFDYKENIHYNHWTNDLNQTEKDFDQKIQDEDDFELLDSELLRLVPAYKIIE